MSLKMVREFVFPKKVLMGVPMATNCLRYLSVRHRYVEGAHDVTEIQTPHLKDIGMEGSLKDVLEDNIETILDTLLPNPTEGSNYHSIFYVRHWKADGRLHWCLEGESTVYELEENYGL